MPPHTMVMNMPEASSNLLPSPSTARLKMLLHMMDVQNPHSAISTMDLGMALPKIVVISGGMKMTAASSAMPANEHVAIIMRAETREPRMPPIAQPIVIVSQ